MLFFLGSTGGGFRPAPLHRGREGQGNITGCRMLLKTKKRGQIEKKEAKIKKRGGGESKQEFLFCKQVVRTARIFQTPPLLFPPSPFRPPSTHPILPLALPSSSFLCFFFALMRKLFSKCLLYQSERRKMFQNGF